MIEKMHKVLFAGPLEIRSDFIVKLQEKGVVEPETYKGELFSKNGQEVDTSSADRILAIFKTLKKYRAEVKDKDLKKDSKISVDHIVKQLPLLEDRLRTVNENELQFNKIRAVLMPLGNFSYEDICDIEKRGKVFLQFWESSLSNFETASFDGFFPVIIKNDGKKVYLLTVSPEKVVIEGLNEIVVNDDIKSIDKKIEENRAKKESILAEIYSFVAYDRDVFNLYLKELNIVHYNSVISTSVEPLDGKIFVVQGWCPEKELNSVYNLVKDMPVTVIEIEPEKKDRIPTFMKNRGAAAIGQELVEFYDTPSYSDWDPSSIVFFSFLLFFSMIMGDGGYGLLLFIIMLVVKFKVKKPKPSGKRIINMGLALTFGTFVYGILSGGFFGLSPDNKIFGWLVKLQLFNGGCTNPDGSMNAIDLNNMMRAAIIIGIAHIMLSLIVKSAKSIVDEKDFFEPIRKIAWIVIMWLFFFYYGKPFMGVPSQLPIQLNVIYVMLGVVAVVSGIKAGSFNPVKVILSAFLGVYDGVQFFSDVLSYIRIFALGLSGALIAQTFNSLAYGLMEHGGLFIALGAFVFIAGHLLNIALCLMSAVIHGLRLNVLEYYRWSFEGAGRAFKPFKNLVN